MNLEFEKGQTVKMASHDNMVVEGAIGVIESTTDVTADVQTRTVKVLWGGMSAFKADYRYRCGFKEIGTTEVDIEDIKLVDKLSSWANAETYQTAGRMDLSAVEAEILEELLPKEPTKEELNAALLKLALDKGWYDDNEEHDIHPVQIPKNQMGIAVKELKAKYPAADGKKIADLVKANLCN